MTGRFAVVLYLIGLPLSLASASLASAQEIVLTPEVGEVAPIAKAIPAEPASAPEVSEDMQVEAELPADAEAPEAVVSDEPTRARAYTSPPADDPSFFLMGEFQGVVSRANALGTSTNPDDVLGLQLRPVGEDGFDAVTYSGGLPGAGGKVEQAMRLIGRRAGDAVVLSGASVGVSGDDPIPVALFVDPQGCSVLDSTGKLLGRLERITRKSPTLGVAAPEGAIVLFDGEQTSNLQNATVTEDGLLEEGFAIKPMIQDFDLHVEFQSPYMPDFDEQKRGNSGIYIHGRYECQVLDSFAQGPKINGLGAIYKAKAPDLNMALPPLQWQTYDIRFTSPRYNADGSKFSDARVTSWVNGVMVQDNVTVEGPTGYGKPEEPVMRPILIQDHNDPVRYRNLWMIDRGLMQVDFPVMASEN